MTGDFMFYTRTLSEDYRVFADDGSEELNYAESFEPLIKQADLKEDDEASAVLIFEKNGGIRLAVFGLERNALDRAGRDIRFSFTQTFPASKLQVAMQAFSKVINEWQTCGKVVSNLIQEIPTTRKDWKDRDKAGEDVRFDYQKFLQWLVSRPASVKPQKNGTMLKYFADTGELILLPCEENDEESGESYMRWLIILLLTALLVIGSLMWFWTRGNEQSSLPAQPLNSQEKPSNTQENSSENLVKTSPETKVETEAEGGVNNDEKPHHTDTTDNISGAGRTSGNNSGENPGDTHENN